MRSFAKSNYILIWKTLCDLDKHFIFNYTKKNLVDEIEKVDSGM